MWCWESSYIGPQCLGLRIFSHSKLILFFCRNSQDSGCDVSKERRLAEEEGSLSLKTCQLKSEDVGADLAAEE